MIERASVHIGIFPWGCMSFGKKARARRYGDAETGTFPKKALWQGEDVMVRGL